MRHPRRAKRQQGHDRTRAIVADRKKRHRHAIRVAVGLNVDPKGFAEVLEAIH